jgi:hypothetical protein
MNYVMQLCESPRYACKSRKNKKEVTLKFKNFILDGDINHELCTIKCILSYVRPVKRSRYLL